MQDKIIVQFGHRSVRGVSDRSLWQFDNAGVLTLLTVTLQDGTSESIASNGLKAVFFVKSFEGRSHDDMRFHDSFPPAECLWVRVTFQDEEVMEGLIYNRRDFVVNAGFFFFPIDPEGNNWLVYVPKDQVKEFNILGLRAAPRNLPDLNGHVLMQPIESPSEVVDAAGTDPQA